MFYKYKGKLYPSYLKDGNAISYIKPIAKYFCKGKGLDIGGTKEWHFPGARFINILNRDGLNAYNLPDDMYDYIISSHTLEHLDDVDKALSYWTDHIKFGGVLFLYLPHRNMEYWAFDNPKHKKVMLEYPIYFKLKTLGYNDLIVSGQDMYWSFTVVGVKGKYVPLKDMHFPFKD